MSSSQPRRRSRSTAAAGRELDGSCNCISILTTSSRTRSGSRCSVVERSREEGAAMGQRKLLVLVLACAAFIASNADAHAFLDHAVPADGSTVHGSPTQVKIWFTQKLEPAFSSAQVLDGGGKRIDKADAKVDASDQTVLQVSLPQL